MPVVVGDDPEARRPWLPLAIIVGSFVVIAGALAAVAVSAGGGGGDATATTSDGGARLPPATQPTDGRDDTPVTRDPADSGSDTSTRPATLFSNFARLRAAPDVDAAEVTTLRSPGMDLEVLGPNTRGWYHVRADGFDGYLFGTFVDPPDAGLRIAETSGGDAVLLDASGRPTGTRNESGPKVLVTDTSGSLWPVLLADGSTAYVDPAAVGLVR